VIRPGLALGALHQIAPDAPGIGQVQSLEERIQIRFTRATLALSIMGPMSLVGSEAGPTFTVVRRAASCCRTLSATPD